MSHRERVCGRPELYTDGLGLAASFCPGCSDGLIHRIMCEVFDEMNLSGKAIGIIGIGCCCAITRGLDIDLIWSLHGRCIPVAAAIKRVNPEAVVFHMEGDGALGAIGAGHFLNAMHRGDRITTIFVNNAGFGRTGGQMAPTSLLGMKTTTTPYGRQSAEQGYPFHGAELAASIKGVAYSARVSVHTPAHYQKAKRAVTIAFEKQLAGAGYSLVEILGTCPTNWQLDPLQSLEFVEKEMVREFPLGEFRNVERLE